MGFYNEIFTITTLLIIHAASVGLAAPSLLVTRPSIKEVEWLPRDNQTVYNLQAGDVRRLELNTSSIFDTPVYITVSPCTNDVHWAVYRGRAGCSERHLTLVQEFSGPNTDMFSTSVSGYDRYVLKLYSLKGGAAAVSVRGETPKYTRLRLRIRSKRRLATSWDPSPIDPQATTYCVVASNKKNYTSLCSAQYDLNTRRSEKNRFSSELVQIKLRSDENDSSISTSYEEDFVGDMFNYDATFYGGFRRRKTRTKATEEDPIITCVGDRTHHLIENLRPSSTYFVSVFGLGRDRKAGALLASSSVHPRTTTARKLRENKPIKTDVKGKLIFYYRGTVGTGSGLWVSISTCGGSVDVEIMTQGKRVFQARDIEPHQNIFVPAPVVYNLASGSDEGSIQFESSSSSEEVRMRYVIKVSPSRREVRNGLRIEITASTSRLGINAPELAPGDGATVRELRPRRSCNTVDIAFLPATHSATDVIRYCISATENITDGVYNICQSNKKSAMKMQCVHLSQEMPAKVIVQKITGLHPGRKYAIQVSASSKGPSVPYKTLFVDTHFSCKDSN